MRVIIIYAVLGTLLLWPHSATPNEPQAWRSYQSAPETIQVDYRYLPEGHIQIRAQREVDTGLGAFLYLLEDVDRIGEWVARAERATILAQPAANSYIVHTKFAGSWPIADRYMVTRSYWLQGPESLTLILDVQDASADYHVPVEGVRMTNIHAQWTLQPIANCKVAITYIGAAHPGGYLPLFLARTTTLSSILDTFAQLPAMLKDYQRNYSGVKEPC
ncbi:START domain-containing protein [Pseudidiomarina sp. E22-M8]|uniref:START domain-containing protein n=1 Tax=Pseudidiomarina sp. E22-M8 TaxID=3424768 RepID=UPI00403CC90D